MEPSDKNRRAWDEVHRRRAQAMQGQLGLPQVVRTALWGSRRPPRAASAVRDRRVDGGARGARGLRDGRGHLDRGARRGARRWPDIAWVQADVQELPSELKRGRFDLVYTADGVLTWLHDLDAWANGITSSLRSGGDFLLHEEHPVAQCVDQSLRWREDYFDEDLHVYRGWSHFELPGPPATEEKVERFWRLGQIVNALAGAGLVVRQLEEYPGTSSWRRLPSRLPGTYILSARKP